MAKDLKDTGWGLSLFDGVPVISSPLVDRGAAFTPGPVIIKAPDIKPESNPVDRDLMRHEVGHVVNFLIAPAFYIQLIAIPSVINDRTGWGGDHPSFYTEKIANTLSEWIYGPFSDPKEHPSYNKRK